MDKSGRFRDFCKLCEEIADESGHVEKSKIVAKWLNDTFTADECDTYLLFKLLLAGEDHRVYHMKDKQLITVFSQIFDEDKDDLIDELNENGDVSDVLSDAFERAEQDIKRSKYSLKKVDELLEKLTTTTKQDDQVELLEGFISRKMSALEFKYLVRLIKKDLRIFAGAKWLLTGLHPDAYQAFQSTHDLQLVVRKALGEADPTQQSQLNASFDLDAFLAASPKKDAAAAATDDDDDEEPGAASAAAGPASKKRKREGEDAKKKQEDSSDSDSSDSDSDDDEDDGKKKKKSSAAASKKKKKAEKKAPAKISTSMKLFYPVKPMLASAVQSYEKAVAKLKNGFFAEIKYDGERIQIHRDGDNFKYYSRSLKPVMQYKVEEVEPYIKKAVKAKRCVLDGEILLIDNKTGQPLPFGTLGKHKKLQQKDSSVAIFLFDALYLEGKSLFDEPLERRRQVLEKAVTPIKNRIILSDYMLAVGTQEEKEAILADRMAKAIEEGLEGLVLKDIKDNYKPQKRHWLKLKKDYLQGMADSVDLVVLGANYGTGSKGGLMSVFLMGCYDPESKKWKTVCKAGNGHDDETLQELQDQFEDNMEKVDRDASRIPDWLECSREVVPDFLVKDPLKSQVWEITGAELTDSEKHSAAGISIRFPRVTRIRDDKGPRDATTQKELVKLYKNSSRTSKVLLKDQIKQKPQRGEEEDDGASSSGAAASAAALPPPAKKAKRSTPAAAAVAALDNDDGDVDMSDTATDRDEQLIKDNEQEDEEIKQLSQSASDQQIENAIRYVQGDICEPIDKNQIGKDKILVHFVDDRGRWSNRGTMGQLVEKFGAACADKYEECSKTKTENKIGSAQLCEISDNDALHAGFAEKVYICNLVAQHNFKSRGESLIHWPSLRDGLKLLARYAKRKAVAQIHINKFHYTVKNLDHKKLDKYLFQFLISKLDSGVEVIVYSKDWHDRRRFGKNPVPLVLRTAAPTAMDTSADFAAPVVPSPVPASDAVAAAAPVSDAMEDDDFEFKLPSPPAVPSRQLSSSSDKPLGKVRAVLLGGSAEEKDAMTSRLQALGATVQNTVNVIPSTKTTHLVIVSKDGLDPQDKLVQHAQKLLYRTAVQPQWLDACEAQKQPVDLHPYQVDLASIQLQQTPAPAAASSSVSTTPIAAEAKPATPTEQVPSNLLQGDLVDIFSDLRIFIVTPAEQQQLYNQLKRVVIAYDGQVTQKLRNATHVVVAEGAKLSDEQQAPASAKRIKSAWIVDCARQKKLLPTDGYIIMQQ